MTNRPALRRARFADAAEMARTVTDGFETFRAFAPQDWTPPPEQAQAAALRGHLVDADFFCVIAEDAGVVAGHVAFMPASRSRLPTDEPGLSHFFQLFVRPAWWGSGLAGRLHALAVEEAPRLGFTAMRLYTPALHARARRFYEREGWTVAGEPHPAPGLGLEIVEYRRPLAGEPAGRPYSPPRT